MKECKSTWKTIALKIIKQPSDLTVQRTAKITISLSPARRSAVKKYIPHGTTLHPVSETRQPRTGPGTWTGMKKCQSGLIMMTPPWVMKSLANTGRGKKTSLVKLSTSNQHTVMTRILIQISRPLSKFIKTLNRKEGGLLTTESAKFQRSSDAFVLTSTTQNKSNACNLTLSKELKMRMTSNSIMTPCKNELPNNFNTILERQIITSINEKQSCGLSSFMIKGFRENWECLDNKTAEITINITIASIFEEQLSQVEKGYKKFLSDKNFKVNEKVWSVEECLGNCVPSIKPPINDDDDKIRVTVAVVVSCIGVFLIVLIAVVVYMKNKRHRILQFHMTRLDDDEDDLIGDMDDFVGNQGPTFRTFR
ncbi:hypothetical protein Btru_049196 [Bulinus truncatus]|nr:hypothetical protein Btru_049196 [Bulinus truncatus]